VIRDRASMVYVLIGDSFRFGRARSTGRGGERKAMQWKIAVEGLT